MDKKTDQINEPELKIEPFSRGNFWKNFLICLFPASLIAGVLADPALFGDGGILIFAVLVPGLMYVSEFLRQKTNSIITFIILLLTSFFVLGIAVLIVNSSNASNTDMGWTEREVQDYMQSCKEAASVDFYAIFNYIDDYKIDLYCSCTLRELMYLYPSAQPSVEEYVRLAVGGEIREIQAYCSNLSF